MKKVFIITCIALVAINTMAQDMREKCVVNSNGKWYMLHTFLSSTDEYPELQPILTKTLFEKESSTVKDGYQNYLKSFKSIKRADESQSKKNVFRQTHYAKIKKRF